MSMALMAVMVSCMCTYPQIHRVVYIKICNFLHVKKEISLKWIIDLSVKSRTKISEDTELSVFLYQEGEGFLVRIQKALTLKRKKLKLLMF